MVLLEQVGLRERYRITEIDAHLKNDAQRHFDIKLLIGSHRNEIHPCHSFRIFAITNMIRAKVNDAIREMLVGHSTGLDGVYYKPTVDELLQEYLKAVDHLTISNENRLQKQLYQYNKKSDDLQLVRTQLTENYEQKTQLIREEMENKFKEMFQMVDIKKLN